MNLDPYLTVKENQLKLKSSLKKLVGVSDCLIISLSTTAYFISFNKNKLRDTSKEGILLVWLNRDGLFNNGNV